MRCDSQPEQICLGRLTDLIYPLEGIEGEDGLTRGQHHFRMSTVRLFWRHEQPRKWWLIQA